MKLLNEKKAQAGFESLLLIGGAIALAVIIGLAVKQAGNNIANTGQDQIANTP